MRYRIMMEFQHDASATSGNLKLPIADPYINIPDHERPGQDLPGVIVSPLLVGVVTAPSIEITPRPEQGNKDLTSESSLVTETGTVASTPKRRNMSHLIVQVGKAMEEEGVSARLSPLEQRMYDTLKSDLSLSAAALAQTLESTAKTIYATKQRLLDRFLDSLPAGRRAQELARVEEEKERVVSPQFVVVGRGKSVARVRALGELLLEHGVEPLPFLTPRGQKMFAFAIENPHLETEQIAEHFLMDPQVTAKTYRHLLAALAQYLPDDVPIPSSLGIRPAASEPSAAPLPESNPTPTEALTETETTIHKPTPDPQKARKPVTNEVIPLTLPDIDQSLRLPLELMGHFILRLEKANLEIGTSPSLSPMQRKMLDALRARPSMSNAQLVEVCGMTLLSVSTIKNRLCESLKKSLPEARQRQEIEHITEIMQRPLYGVAQYESPADAIRTVKNILSRHDIDPLPLLSSHHREIFEVIVGNPELGIDQIATRLDMNFVALRRLCGRMIKRMSLFIPPEAEIPPILRPFGPDHAMARKVGDELLAVILQRNLVYLAHELKIGSTALKNFLTGRDISPVGEVLDPLLRLLGLPPEKAADLREHYIASMGKENPDKE